MNNMKYSLDPNLYSYQYCDIEIDHQTQNILHFEPIHIISQQNKFYNLKKEINYSPFINYDSHNSQMYYQKIQVQKTRIKKAIQSRNSKYRQLPDLDSNTFLTFIQPLSKTVEITQRKSSQPQKSICHFKNDKQYQHKLQTKMKIRLPILQQHQVQSPCKSTLNCWTRQTTSSLFQED